MKKISLKQKILLIIFGLFVCIILLEIGLRIGGFVILSIQEFRNQLSIKQKGEYRILCLGESTTASGGKNSYPRQLERILNEKDIGIKFGVVNKGIIGTNTGIILSILEKNLNTYNPNMVIVMMGINDALLSLPKEDHNKNKGIARFLFSSRIYKLVWFVKFRIKEKQSLKKNPVNTIRFNDVNNKSDLEKGREYLQAGWSFKEKNKIEKAKEMFKRSLDFNPDSDWAYIGLGWCYKETNEYDIAEQMFKKSLEFNPKSDAAYVGLGSCYRGRGEHEDAIRMLNKSISLNPMNKWAYFNLGWCHKELGDSQRAVEMFEEALELDIEESWAYIGLGWCYKDIGSYIEAENIFNELMKVKPEEDLSYFELAQCYNGRGNYNKSIEVLKKGLDIGLKSPLIYGMLGITYGKLKQNVLSEKYFEQASLHAIGINRLSTRYNYRKLRDILKKRNIKLICVQYPMCYLEKLKNVIGQDDKVIFVDNAKVFKDAVVKEGYGEYFTDCFAGNFGHCTKKGNKLLAENIANSILKDCFKR